MVGKLFWCLISVIWLRFTLYFHDLGSKLKYFFIEFGSEAVTLLKESVNVAVKFLDKHLLIHVAGSTEPTTESTANHVNALNSAGQTPIYTAVLDGIFRTEITLA